MTRPIKFRAWNGKYWMINTLGDIWDSEGTTKYPSDTLVFQQFTGLLDKNGKEIYEGDILSIDDTDTPIFLVHWRRQHACFGMKRLDHEHEDNLTDWSEEKAYRVIGNIYENPNLIKN